MKRGTITIKDARISVTLSPEGSVRMTVEEIASIFHVTAVSIERHIQKIFAKSELDEDEVRTRWERRLGSRRCITEYYNLDMIVALSFRIDTSPGKAFRRWIVEQATRTLETEQTVPILLPIGFFPGGAN